MERDRQQKIRLRQKLASGAGHLQAERLGEFEPVAIFQPVDQMAHRPVLETRDGAGPRIDGRMRDGLRRQQAFGAKIGGKGGAQPVTIGLLDETHLLPTRGAERAMSLNGGAAGNAGGRKNHVERCVAKMSRGSANGHRGSPGRIGFGVFDQLIA